MGGISTATCNGRLRHKTLRRHPSRSSLISAAHGHLGRDVGCWFRPPVLDYLAARVRLYACAFPRGQQGTGSLLTWCLKVITLPQPAGET